MKIEKTPLLGSRVRLEPLTHAHLKGLEAAINDGKLWELAFTYVPYPNDLPKFIDDAELNFLSESELAFATIDADTGTVVGSTRFRSIDTQHKRVEIGGTFIAESWQKTHVNTEAKYLMLSHAFEEWGVNRVEFRTDFINSKSRKALARLGASEEGVLRNHMTRRDGSVRDSVLFSIINSEWPAVKQALALKLGEV